MNNNCSKKISLCSEGGEKYEEESDDDASSGDGEERSQSLITFCKMNL